MRAVNKLFGKIENFGAFSLKIALWAFFISLVLFYSFLYFLKPSPFFTYLAGSEFIVITDESIIKLNSDLQKKAQRSSQLRNEIPTVMNHLHEIIKQPIESSSFNERLYDLFGQELFQKYSKIILFYSDKQKIGFGIDLKQTVNDTSKYFKDNKKFQIQWAVGFNILADTIFYSLYFSGLFILIAEIGLFFLSRTEVEEAHVRGAEIYVADDEKEQEGMEINYLKKLIEPFLKKSDMQLFFRLMISKIIGVPFDWENRSISIVGVPGAGKSTMIYGGWLQSIQDEDSGFITSWADEIENWYRPEKDFILNPQDARSVRWNIFLEMEGPDGEVRDEMYELLAEYLFPTSKNSADNIWIESSRNVMQAVLRAVRELALEKGEKPNNSHLKKFLDVNSSAPKLKKTFEESFPHLYIQVEETLAASDNTVSSMMFTFGLIAKIFRKPYWGQPGSWSVSGFIDKIDKGQTKGSFLYLFANEQQKAAYAPIFNLLISLSVAKILTLSESRKRRIFYFLDEFPALGKNDLLPKAPAQGRKRGFCGIFAWQSHTQMKELYGDNWETYLATSVVQIYYRVTDKFTIDYAVTKIGDKESRRHETNISVSDKNTSATISETSSRVMQKALTNADLENLPDFWIYLKVGSFPWIKLKILLTFRDDKRPKNQTFIPNKVWEIDYNVKPRKQENKKDKMPVEDDIDDQNKQDEDEEADNGGIDLDLDNFEPASFASTSDKTLDPPETILSSTKITKLIMHLNEKQLNKELEAATSGFLTQTSSKTNA